MKHRAVSLATLAAAAWAALALTGYCLAATDPHLQQAINAGRKTFASDTFGGNGLTCNSCHTNLGQTQGHLPNGAVIPSLTNAAAVFPRYKADHHKVMTLDEQIHGCIAGALQGKAPAYGSRKLVDLVSYISSLAKGKPIDIGAEPK